MTYTPHIILFIIALIYTLGAAHQDYKSMTISNQYNLNFLYIALGFNIILSCMSGWGILIHGLISLAIVFCILFLFYAIGGMGAGDVKLLSVLALLLGYKYLLIIFIASIIFSTIFLAGKYLYLLWPIVMKSKDSWTSKFTNSKQLFIDNSKAKYPFAISIFCGTIAGFILYTI